MTSHFWLLDPGHGEETPGKRSPLWDDGRQLREFEFNRSIVRRLVVGLRRCGVSCAPIVTGPEDVSLSGRVAMAHHLASHSALPAVFLSVHANAGGGTGWEVWTSRGQTKSDEIATVFARHAAAYMPDMVVRTDYDDGDPDKEADFYVLRHTRMPAVLVEFAFMDRLDPDCLALMSERGRDHFAAMTINAILEIEEAP
ncbi:MAG TPA: N-acetylmuramoyl-L-alanine amidase [Vicinamibacterales bacterium]|nr:N-acetylmuramoyl-L-alanine amidase [Vicinamibacterales bacterium]